MYERTPATGSAVNTPDGPGAWPNLDKRSDMEQGMFDFADEGASTPAKLCDCGCGQPAPIAQRNVTSRGWIKGRPIRFLHGHGRRKPRKIRKPVGQHPTLFVEVGQRFGRGVVIDPDVRIPRKRSPAGLRGARLRCDCGNEYIAELSSLYSGSVRSCKCLQRDSARQARANKGRPIVDRTGKRFGMLTVISFVDTKDGHARWLCRCDCGNEIVRGAAVSRSASCGCLLTPRKGRSAPAPGRAPGEASRLHVLRQYRSNAKLRGYSWELTDEEFDRLTSSDCRYCGTPPSRTFSTGSYEGAEFTYNGLDRVNNALGYTSGNTVPCCSICNIAKRDLSYDEFLAWIARLTDYHWFHPDVMPSRRLREVREPA